MDKVPWVGNGSGMGTVVKPNAGLWFEFKNLVEK